MKGSKTEDQSCFVQPYYFDCKSKSVWLIQLVNCYKYFDYFIEGSTSTWLALCYCTTQHPRDAALCSSPTEEESESTEEGRIWKSKFHLRKRVATSRLFHTSCYCHSRSPLHSCCGSCCSHLRPPEETASTFRSSLQRRRHQQQNPNCSSSCKSCLVRRCKSQQQQSCCHCWWSRVQSSQLRSTNLLRVER